MAILPLRCGVVSRPIDVTTATAFRLKPDATSMRGVTAAWASG